MEEISRILEQVLDLGDFRKRYFFWGWHNFVDFFTRDNPFA